MDDSSNNELEIPAEDVKCAKPKTIPVPRAVVEQFLNVYRDHQADLNGGTKLKKDVWESIAIKMQESGYQMSGSRWNQKWRNMVRTYTVFFERLEHPLDGEKPVEVPWYFDQVGSILTNQHFLSVQEDSSDHTDAATDRQSQELFEMKPSPVIPAAPRVAVRVLNKRKRSAPKSLSSAVYDMTTDTSLLNNNTSSDMDAVEDDWMEPVNLVSERKAVKLEDEERVISSPPQPDPPASLNAVVDAIRQAEASRRADEELRHSSLLQELRRQHYEHMSLLSNILDVLSRNGHKDGR